MSRPTTIETPFPSLEETAGILGVSVSQAERVRRLISVAKRNGRVKARGTSTRRATKYAAKKASKRA